MEKFGNHPGRLNVDMNFLTRACTALWDWLQFLRICSVLGHTFASPVPKWRQPWVRLSARWISCLCQRAMAVTRKLRAKRMTRGMKNLKKVDAFLLTAWVSAKPYKLLLFSTPITSISPATAAYLSCPKTSSTTGRKSLTCGSPEPSRPSSPETRWTSQVAILTTQLEGYYLHCISCISRRIGLSNSNISKASYVWCNHDSFSNPLFVSACAMFQLHGIYYIVCCRATSRGVHV